MAQYKLAGYTINLRDRLGKGGYGTVYKARDSTGTIVAAKEIDKIKDLSSKAALRELENAHKQKQLNHENIAKILDIYKDDEQIWLFIEFCNGGDLNDYAKTNFQEFNAMKISLMKQIAEGLVFLHSNRIAHRDMKPENILIQKQAAEEGITVKLTDFGVAKFIPLNAKSSAMHTNLGTHTYKAPDFWNSTDGQIEYHKNIDVYAMGLTFLAMLQVSEGKNLKPVAEGCDLGEQWMDIGNVMHVRLITGRPELVVVRDNESDTPEILTVKEIIRRAAAVRPQDRPTVESIIEMLKPMRITSGIMPPIRTQITKLNTVRADLSSMSGFCARRDGEEVFMSGKPDLQAQYVIHRYNRTAELLNTWQVKCGHSLTQCLLHLSIGGTPYIAMSCYSCQSITLCDLTDSDPITAYSNLSREDMASPFALCHGPDNTILASNVREGNREVLVYDATSTQFTLKDRIPVDVDQAECIHYMETDQQGGIVMVSDRYSKIISAHSIESKALVWKIENRELDRRVFYPTGICSDPDTGTLYVGDFFNERVIAIEPNMGEVIQSMQLPEVGRIHNIAWCNVQPHLVVCNSENQITYYNIN